MLAEPIESPEGPRLSAVVVHWRDEESLGELVAAWPDDERFELLVVDNGGSIASLPGPARLLSPGANLGFAGGANRGAAAARGELVLVLNPDARPEPGALEALLDGADRHPGAAGVVPRLVGPRGESQARWQLRHLPRPWQLVLHGLFVDPVPGQAPPPPGAPIEQPAAAALLLRKRVWGELGGFDERFRPAWFEDVDLAKRLRERGERLVYWPAATFRHRQGGSLPALGYGPFLTAYYGNLLRYLHKHHGPAWAGAGRIAVAAGMLARLALVPVRRPRRAPDRGDAARGLLACARRAIRGGFEP